VITVTQSTNITDRQTDCTTEVAQARHACRAKNCENKSYTAFVNLSTRKRESSAGKKIMHRILQNK